MEQEDKILRDLIQENEPQVGPSMRFTADIMQTIAAKQAAKAKPLIGRRAWFLLALGFMGIIITAFILAPTQISRPDWFPNFDQIPFSFDSINTPIIAIVIGFFFIIFDEVWRRIKKAPQAS